MLWPQFHHPDFGTVSQRLVFVKPSFACSNNSRSTKCEYLDGSCLASPRWVSLLVAEIYYPDVSFPNPAQPSQKRNPVQGGSPPAVSTFPHEWAFMHAQFMDAAFWHKIVQIKKIADTFFRITTSYFWSVRERRLGHQVVEEPHLNVMARTSWDATKSGFTTTGFSFLEAASAGKMTSLTNTLTRGDNRKALSVQKNCTIN